MGKLKLEQIAPDLVAISEVPPRQMCANCAYFGQTPPPGRMPGVGPEHRRCNKPKIAKEQRPWTPPTAWCDAWQQRKPN